MDTQQAQPYKNPLGYEPVGKLLRKFALPAVVSMLVNALYNIVDQIFIGQGVGYLGNAATTVAFPVVTIVLAVGTLLGAGGSAFAAIKLGEKKDEDAEYTLGNMFVLLVGIGAIITILGLLFLEPILRVFGATDTIMPYAKDYTSIILLGVIFNLLGIGLSNFSRTDGSPNFSMYSILIGCSLNAVLDPIYIFIFHWGVKGAAVATITSQLISAIMLVWYFRCKGRMRLRARYMKLSPKIYVGAISLGVSSCILQLASTLLQIVMNNSLVYYGDRSEVTGDIALSAMGVVMKAVMILVSVCIGIGIGSQPILGFNRGANQPHRIKHCYRIAVTISTTVSFIGWLACMIFPGPILSIFGTQDANFSIFAEHCMRVFIAGAFASGFQIVSTSYFQATGQPLKATILSMMRQIILLIPLVLLLPLFFGLDGILYAGPVSDIGAALVTGIFIVHEMKRLNKWIAENDAQSATGSQAVQS